MGILSWLRPKNKSAGATAQATAINAAPLNFFRGDFTLLNSEEIFSAVSRISNALAAIPIQLYKGAEPARNDLNDLIRHAPNPNMTSTDFFRTLEATRDTYGNGYALKQLDGNFNLSRLDILDPSKVKPAIDEQFGELWYRVALDTGEERYIHNFYLIHVKFISSNGYEGIDPTRVLFSTLQYADEIQKLSLAQIQKGINASVFVESPYNISDAQKKRALELLTEVHRSTKGNVLMLESGMQAKQINASAIDPKALDVSKLTASKVARVYNIPPPLMGDFTSMSGTNSATEQLMLQFMTLTIMPIVALYEQELNKKLLTAAQRKQGHFWRFDVDALLRADLKTQADVNYKAIRSGILTPNEIRAQRGLPPEENGGGLFVSRDLVPLSALMNIGNLPSGN